MSHPQHLPGKESRWRSILKALTYRLSATVITFLLALFVFQQANCDGVLERSTVVALLELGSKFIFYYLHERAWQAVPRGKIRSLFSRQKSQ